MSGAFPFAPLRATVNHYAPQRNNLHQTGSSGARTCLRARVRGGTHATGLAELMRKAGSRNAKGPLVRVRRLAVRLAALPPPHAEWGVSLRPIGAGTALGEQGTAGSADYEATRFTRVFGRFSSRFPGTPQVRSWISAHEPRGRSGPRCGFPVMAVRQLSEARTRVVVETGR
jgi:hypothetical protein